MVVDCVWRNFVLEEEVIYAGEETDYLASEMGKSAIFEKFKWYLFVLKLNESVNNQRKTNQYFFL